ncbi:unnamed protein product, partial [Adineta ricciae]
ECKKVVEYRSNLKEQVEHALSADKLLRLMPQDHVQPTEFRLKQNVFPIDIRPNFKVELYSSKSLITKRKSFVLLWKRY